MSSQEIQSLLAPADTQQAYSKASIYLNSKFSSLEDLGCLEKDVTEAQQRRDELETRVRRIDTGSHLHAHRLHTSSASSFQVKNQHSHSRNASGRRVTSVAVHKNCPLERHSLADELASLSQDLVSSLSDVNRPPTLLEDIETLHRNLKELKSVKGIRADNRTRFES